MRKEDLWIGDWVEIIDSSIIGRYEGVAPNGKAKVKVNNAHLLISFNNLKIAKDPEPPMKPILFADENPKPNQELTFKNKLDLHIDILAPHLENAPPQRILSFQVQACKSFIENSIKMNVKIVYIIHGKGEGVLKSEVLHLLNGFEEIKFIIPSPSGGAIEVWFKD